MSIIPKRSNLSVTKVPLHTRAHAHPLLHGEVWFRTRHGPHLGDHLLRRCMRGIWDEKGGTETALGESDSRGNLVGVQLRRRWRRSRHFSVRKLREGDLFYKNRLPSFGIGYCSSVSSGDFLTSWEVSVRVLRLAKDRNQSQR